MIGRFPLAAAAVVACAALPTDARAQQDARTGAFHVRLHAEQGEDRSLVFLFPQGDRGWSPVMWACGEDDALVVALRGRDVRRPGTREVVARFDDDAPETIALESADSAGIWFFSAADAERFTARARRAARLHMVMRTDSADEGPTERSYTLREAEAALGQLACGAGAAARGTPGGRATLRAAVEKPWIGRDGRLTDADPEVFPRALNASRIGPALLRAYPESLRGSGIRGEVHLRFRVDERGRVDPRSITSMRSTSHDFTRAAAEVARQFRFRPASVYGDPVRVWVEQPLVFQDPGRE